MLNIIMQNYLNILIFLLLILIVFNRFNTVKELKKIDINLKEHIKHYNNHFNTIYRIIADLRLKKKDN